MVLTVATVIACYKSLRVCLIGLLLLLYMNHCDCVGRQQVSPQVTGLCKQVEQDTLCKIRSSQVPLTPCRSHWSRIVQTK